MFTYLISPRGAWILLGFFSPRGPFRSGKLRVLSAWMPAAWSPSNGVTFPEQPASLASFGSANHNPRWKVCTGLNLGFFSASWLSTCGAFTLPGAMANTSSLKIPMKRPLPLPLLSVDMSPWYQEMPKGSLGCWMTNRVYSVFLAACLSVTSMIWLPTGVERMSTLADAPSRQSLATADWERTILKEVSSTAKAAAANKAAISSAALTASTTRLVVVFLLTFLFLSWFHDPSSLRFIRRSPLLLARPLEEAGCLSPCAPLSPLWACIQQLSGNIHLLSFYPRRHETG